MLWAVTWWQTLNILQQNLWHQLDSHANYCQSLLPINDSAIIHFKFYSMTDPYRTRNTPCIYNLLSFIPSICGWAGRGEKLAHERMTEWTSEGISSSKDFKKGTVAEERHPSNEKPAGFIKEASEKHFETSRKGKMNLQFPQLSFKLTE